jgi:hypothetical protein
MFRIEISVLQICKIETSISMAQQIHQEPLNNNQQKNQTYKLRQKSSQF